VWGCALRNVARARSLLLDIKTALVYFIHMEDQCFYYTCPSCNAGLKASDVAATLPDEIISLENARRMGRNQTPHAGPGRPTLARCPGCDSQMSAADLIGHRVSCVRQRLENLRKQGVRVRLRPKDPDPYPDFMITALGDETIEFEKLSSDQRLTIELRKIAEITVDQQLLSIRLLGRVRWVERGIPRPEWQFAPSQRVGRPRRHAARQS